MTSWYLIWSRMPFQKPRNAVLKTSDLMDKPPTYTHPHPLPKSSPSFVGANKLLCQGNGQSKEIPGRHSRSYLGQITFGTAKCAWKWRRIAGGGGVNLRGISVHSTLPRYQEYLSSSVITRRSANRQPSIWAFPFRNGGIFVRWVPNSPDRFCKANLSPRHHQATCTWWPGLLRVLHMFATLKDL